MDLLQNPFHILKASPRDNRRLIMELADECILLLDSSECMEARAVLTNPRKRLAAEIAWLPGLSPRNYAKVLAWVNKPSKAIPKHETLLALTPMARANLLASGLASLSKHNPDDIVKWILAIAWAYEDIDPEKLRVIVNEERIVSGFPEVSDLSAVEAEIQERRRHYLQVIKSALDNLSPKELVEAVTAAVESATDDGEVHGPILISDLVDSYEVEAQGFLDKEEGNIKALVEKLRAAVDTECPDSTLAPMVNKLIQVVKNWDTVAQPIQVSTKSRGLNHDASHRVAGLIRGLAIHMFNEHGKLDLSQKLTDVLQNVFAQVVEVAERIAEDADALQKIEEQRIQLAKDANREKEEWREAISIDIDFGVILKKMFRISPDGIKWKGRLTPLEEVTRIRWGVLNNKYSISYGNASFISHIKLELESGSLFNVITGSLWKAVGVRLLTEFLEGLRDGKKYRFGSAVLSDNGMELERKKIFGSNEQIFCRWSELVIWNGPGVFCIGKKDDKKLSATFSYQGEDNIHVLETAIRMFWKRGGDRLSSLLGE